MSAVTQASPLDGIAALLRGEPVSWRSLGITPAALFDACAEEDLTGLVHLRLCRLPEGNDWPAGLREDLAREARIGATTELLRRQEILTVLGGLAAAGVHPILLKGTALAYSVYEVPSSRPRGDTDLLVRREDLDIVRRVMTALGHTAPAYCDGELLFCQFELGRVDAFAVHHAFDFHWKISTQPVFADLLSYDELAASAVPVPALGPHARAAGWLHALFLACIHPVMHHRNIERLLWIHDVHLLASRLSANELDRFVDLARTRQVSAIAARELALARERVGTRIPDRVMTRLVAPNGAEASAIYLRPDRRWHHELISSVQGLSRWTDRWRLLREVLLPGPRYMFEAYGVHGGPVGVMVLPALYVHRGLRGVWRVVSGRK